MKKLEKRTDEQVRKHIDSMSDFELARWQSMIDGVNMIYETCEDKKIKFNDVDIKPSAIEKYIEATCDIHCRKLQEIKEKKAKYIIKDIMPDIMINFKGVKI